MVIQQSSISNGSSFYTNAGAAGSSSKKNPAQEKVSGETSRAGADDAREKVKVTRQEASDNAKKQEIIRDENEIKRLEALARREEERENVIARSEDGDTLQVENEDEKKDIGEVKRLDDDKDRDQKAEFDREEIDAPEIEMPEREPVQIDREPARSKIEDQIEIIEGAAAQLQKEITQPDIEGTAEQLAQKDADRFKEQNITSYAGISDSRLEQMYRDGIISRYDYESEIESRDAAKEQLMDDNEKIAKDMSRIEGEGERTRQNFEAIRTATSDNSDDTLKAGERLDIIDNLQNTARDEIRREEDNNRVWQYQSLA